MSTPENAKPRFSRRSLWLCGLGGALSVALTVAHGLSSRQEQSERLRQWTEAQAIPTVAIVQPGKAGSAGALELPGRLEAFSAAPIHARVNGYLKSWKTEMGTPVKAGQLLAEIETPELDQQFLQAQADLASAEVEAKLAASTAQRWKSLLATDSAAQQDVDEKLSSAAAKQAALKSARANVDRYAALQNFKRIVAPFNGVVTARNTDVGALINVGAGDAQALFVVSDIRNLRVYIRVPQNYLPKVPPGTHASIAVPERPGRNYEANVSASAKAVDANSGTSLMQLTVDNRAGELLPGSYAVVKLDLPKDLNALTVPASALIIDAQGIHVASVAADQRVLLKPVSIARDLGKLVEIGTGLNSDDRLIDSPPDGIANGDEVRIAQPAKGEGKPG